MRANFIHSAKRCLLLFVALTLIHGSIAGYNQLEWRAGKSERTVLSTPCMENTVIVEYIATDAQGNSEAKKYAIDASQTEEVLTVLEPNKQACHEEWKFYSNSRVSESVKTWLVAQRKGRG